MDDSMGSTNCLIFQNCINLCACRHLLSNIFVNIIHIMNIIHTMLNIKIIKSVRLLTILSCIILNGSSKSLHNSFIL